MRMILRQKVGFLTMRSSIFRRLLEVNFATIIVSALVIGLSFYVLIYNYTYQTRLDLMRQNIYQIIDLVDYQTTYNQSVATMPFRRDLGIISQSMQSYIFITNTNGVIISSSVSDLNYSVIDLSQFSKVLEGYEVSKTGKIEGLSEHNLLTLAAPITLTNNAVIGAVLICSPMPSIARVSYNVLERLLFSLLLAAVLMIIFSYMMARRLSKPIKEMSIAAGEFSMGNFSKRIKSSGNDEIGQLAESFNSMAASLENTERIRQSFISNVSHDLRTPITSITGFVDGILDGTVPPEKVQDYLQIVSSESKRLALLVNRFLDLSRLEEGEMKLDISSFDINELVCQTIFSFEKRIMGKNIHINMNIKNEKCIVLADKDKIIRVLTNLIDNAVKFTEVGGEITLTVVKDKPVRISVQNTGVEIQPEDLQFIWNRFYKADKSRSMNREGTGLGLFIVKSILDRHKQKIHVSSKDGLTTFTFTLERE